MLAWLLVSEHGCLLFGITASAAFVGAMGIALCGTPAGDEVLLCLVYSVMRAGVEHWKFLMLG